MATYEGESRGEAGLQGLIDSSPAPRARTSMAAEASLVCGLGAILAAPFSILFGVSALLGAIALLTGLVGLITTHRADVAGSALTAFGSFLGACAIALIGVRYLGLHSAFGDNLVPWIADQLHHWNTRLPQPR
jgi:hypothetical protein